MVNTKDSYNSDFFNGIIEAKKKGYLYSTSSTQCVLTYSTSSPEDISQLGDESGKRVA